MHNFHWHGNVLDMDGHRMDQVVTIPASTMALDLLPDNPGEWLFHCHVSHKLYANDFSIFRSSHS